LSVAPATRAPQRAGLEAAGNSVVDVADARMAMPLLRSVTSPLVVAADRFPLPPVIIDRMTGTRYQCR
jgi:hypothetical protein